MRRHLAGIIVAMQRQRTAFTLVELLVVIGVISLLMGILLPVVNKARAIALRATCRANLHSIGVAMRAYLEDYRNIMPPAVQMPSLYGPNDPCHVSITTFLLPYLSDPKIFKCPADKGQGNPPQNESYFLLEGTSYQYNDRLGGQPVWVYAKRVEDEEIDIYVMRDYAWFHGPQDANSSYNYLYADGHVSDSKDQK